MTDKVLCSDKTTIDFPEFLLIVSNYLNDNEMIDRIIDCYIKLKKDEILSMKEFKEIVNRMCFIHRLLLEFEMCESLKSMGELGEHYTLILGEKVDNFLETKNQTIDCATFIGLIMSIVCKSDNRCCHIYDAGCKMSSQCKDNKTSTSTYCTQHYKKKKSILYKYTSRLKATLSYTTIPNRYTLTCLIKTQDFWKWYCGEGIGKEIDHSRIMNMKFIKD